MHTQVVSLSLPVNESNFRFSSEIGLDEIPKSVCWLNFNILLMSSRTGYASVNINDHSSNFIEIEDRATIPNIVQFDLNSSVIW